MRTVIGYQDGKPLYRDDGPANGAASLPSIGGRLDFAGPGAAERNRLAVKKCMAKMRAAAREARQQAPRPMGAPRKSDDVILIGRGSRPGYQTDEERLAARRQAWRDSKRRMRAARAA